MKFTKINEREALKTTSSVIFGEYQPPRVRAHKLDMSIICRSGGNNPMEFDPEGNDLFN